MLLLQINFRYCSVLAFSPISENSNCSKNLQVCSIIFFHFSTLFIEHAFMQSEILYWGPQDPMFEGIDITMKYISMTLHIPSNLQSPGQVDAHLFSFSQKCIYSKQLRLYLIPHILSESITSLCNSVVSNP